MVEVEQVEEQLHYGKLEVLDLAEQDDFSLVE